MNTQPFQVIGVGAGFLPNLKANVYEVARLCVFFNAKLILIHIVKATPEKQEKLSEIMAPFAKDVFVYELVFKAEDSVDVF